MSEIKVSSERAIELAEKWLKEKRDIVLKAKGPASLLRAKEYPDLYERDTWSVYFELEDPGLRTTSLDHMFLDVDAETGKVRQMHPHIEPNEE
jgi:hypothetical protein